ncbi:MAG: aminoacyl-histidine dipeptidase [Spirochaetaceae bacterium]
MSSENMQAVKGLAPEEVWERFAELSAIPRCSKQEEGVRRWILSIAEERGLESTVDGTGNVLVRKPGSGAYADRPPVALQAHMDMVCEKNAGTKHDFEKDSITLVREDDWVRANRTTLGADNGIAVAMMVALLIGELEHPPLECLFTVDEETGLTGALKLEPNLLTAKRLINIDTEEEGHFCIGCAGGRNSYAYLPVSRDSGSEGRALRIFLSGLRGGHSGMNIGEGRGNAIELGARVLYDLLRKREDLRLLDIHGGGKHNAIPRELEAAVLISGNPGELQSLLEEWKKTLLEEFGDIEPGLDLSLQELQEEAPEPMDQATTGRVIRLLAALPHGVLAMSRAVPGLVETSTNLAAVRIEKEELVILTSQRSSRGSGVDDAVRLVRAPVELAGGRVEEAEGYPAWTPNPDSELLTRAVDAYAKVAGSQPVVEAVHAGLECGVIGDKYPGMEMLSFGPDIEGAHTPEERVRISSVERSWNFLKKLLQEI